MLGYVECDKDMNYKEINIFYGKKKYKLTIIYNPETFDIEVYLNDSKEPLQNKPTNDIFLR